jgi:hypothetical protein
MHKHDPVPPLPGDVPRPIADLVYAMLAKNPEDRPESARHVADRAEVIREAGNRNGYNGPNTSDFPVVPNFPPATSLDLYQGGAPERLPVSRNVGNRTFLIAGTGAAAIGAAAIVAVLISSNGSSNMQNVGGNVTMPTQTQSAVASHKAGASPSVTRPVGSLVGGNLGNGVVGTATGTTSPSKSPTASQSPTPTGSPTPTKSPTPSQSPVHTTPPPTTAPPTTQPPTTRPPTTQPPTTPPASSTAKAGTTG